MYNQGQMPNSKGTYEDFEGLIGSYYKSLLPLKESGHPEDVTDFEAIERLLGRICERNGVQTPEYCVKSPRTEKEWANPREMSCDALFTGMNAFASFGLVYNQDEERDLYTLHQTLALIFSRHGVANIEFRERLDGTLQAVKIHGWNTPINHKFLKDIIPKRKPKESKIILPGQ